MSAMGTSLSFDEIPFITRVANFAYVTLYLIQKKLSNFPLRLA